MVCFSFDSVEFYFYAGFFDVDVSYFPAFGAVESWVVPPFYRDFHLGPFGPFVAGKW